MYITCQKCNTVFRLDERLLKPTGSKVRCSQCGNIFTAVPPAPAESESEPVLETPLWSDMPPTEQVQESASLQENSPELSSESADLQIELDFEAELDSDPLAPETPEPGSTAEILGELDLDADFTLNAEEPAPVDISSSAAEPPDESLLEMELEGLFLEDQNQLESAPEPPPLDNTLNEDFSAALQNFDNSDPPMDDSVTLFVDMSDSAEGEVDIDDLDLELGLDQAPQAHDALEVATEADRDLELDLEEELQLAIEATEAPVNSEGMFTPDQDMEGEGGELNFADLEGILETEEDNPASADRIEEELSLDLIDHDEPAAVSEEKEELDELTLELDSTYKDKHLEPEESALPQETAADEAEIDLSDLEQILEGTAVEPVPLRQSDDKQPDSVGESGELDLAELEAAIEEVETRADSDTEHEEDLEFSQLPEEEELQLENDALKAIDLELDTLADLEIEKGKPAKVETFSSNDMDLEFHVEDEPLADEPVATAVANAATPDTESLPIPPPIMEEIEEISDAPTEQKLKKSNTSLVVLAIILFLALVGFALYYAVNQMGVTLPFISDYLKPVEQDPAGVRHLSTLEINSKFFENNQSGRLFVISGTIRNAYPEARTNIRLQGKLYTKGKKLAKAENVYAGIMVDDQEVASGSVAEIKKRLETVPGPHEPAVRALPNQSLPFMVVFSELPDTSELDEFAVEPISSTPVK